MPTLLLKGVLALHYKPTKEHLKPDSILLPGTNSATECTGLFAVPPKNEDEFENYKEVYNYGVPELVATDGDVHFLSTFGYFPCLS